METTADKIAKAQQHFGADATLANSLSNHLQNKNYDAYANEFVAGAKSHNIILTSDEVKNHFGFTSQSTLKDQVKETVKDEVKGAAKDEATSKAEDEISNQLGVDVSGVGDAAGGILDTIKGWFGGNKKK